MKLELNCPYLASWGFGIYSVIDGVLYPCAYFKVIMTYLVDHIIHRQLIGYESSFIAMLESG